MKYRFRAPIARRLPDPVFNKQGGGERVILFARACDLPLGMSMEPNVRSQNPDKKVYKTVARSLRNEHGEPDTFHLKNKGITVFAEEVHKVSEDEYEVVILPGQGIVDGGHTYRIIEEAVKEGECPSTQYVKVEILTKISNKLLADVADGLNTSVQVQLKSLANHRGHFDWIHEELRGAGFDQFVAYRENEDGAYDIREIIAILTLFNIGLHPNDAAVQDYPIGAFSGKEKNLEKYLNDENGVKAKATGEVQTYRKLKPVVKDILVLFERVAKDGPVQHNKQNSGKAGKLAFVDHRPGKEHLFSFLNESGPSRLLDGALYPAVGAFRYLVVADEATGEYRWRPENGFDGVLEVWDVVAGEVMRSLQDASDDLSRNANAMGKNRGLWSNLYSIVKAKALEVCK